jgi:hypothetical protein
MDKCAEVQRTARMGINSKEKEGKYIQDSQHLDWQSVSGHSAKEEVRLAKGHMKGSQNQGYKQNRMLA